MAHKMTAISDCFVVAQFSLFGESLIHLANSVEGYFVVYTINILWELRIKA